MELHKELHGVTCHTVIQWHSSVINDQYTTSNCKLLLVKISL